uniref:NADH-ubiquinone oxidoreductase chain 6 n=1 Tax=Sminthurides bifidus TaxID=2584528 RepID=A0A6H0EWZ0_9HEXA|nr:NADH dehydrogenase subunit 6 [Sminthurides bifidus]
MKNWILFISVVTFNFLCISFISSWAPLLSAMCIVFMSLDICFLMTYLTYTSWFSYILFLIFLGGLMVLFTYMCSVAPNEFTKPELVKKMWYALLYSLMAFMVVEWNPNLWTKTTESSIQFMTYSMNLSIMIISIVYLLLTLIVAVNISSYKYGPIRAKKN